MKTRRNKSKFLPAKYYRGLTLKQKIQRKKEIERFGAKNWKDPKAYVGFKTDRYAKTKKKSQYTQEWDRMFPEAKSIQERSKVTGVPEKFIEEVYNRGMAAWRTGHRPGMSPQAWSYPRTSSFLLCGKTYYTADADLVKAAKAESKSAQKWWSKTCKKLKGKWKY